MTDYQSVEKIEKNSVGVAFRQTDEAPLNLNNTQNHAQTVPTDAVKTLKDIEIPFDRNDVTVGIVHIGAGRFHRAHEAVYCHELLALGEMQSGICAAYILPSDRAVVDALAEQAGLYSLVERDAGGETAKVVGSIVEILDGHALPAAVINRLADPSVQVVTFTVTEAGYFFEPTQKNLLLDHPCISNDLENPLTPQTLYGYLAAGLAARRAAGLPPLTVQSCDNIQGNGDMTRALFIEFLRARDEKLNDDLAEWVSAHVSFPNSMVDRITPAAEPSESARARELFGCDDKLAVTSESYRQWVIEDNFCNGRPAWEKVGVQFVESVKPFEQIKIRLLNAGHSAIAYAGYLAGLETIGEIVSNAVFCDYLKKFFAQVEQTLPAVPGVDIAAYQAKLIERFTNPAIVDQSLRICKDGSAKIPGFVMPTLRELLAKQLPTDSFAYLLASYYAFLSQQLNTQGVEGIDDPEREKLAALVKQADGEMIRFLADDALFGDLAAHVNFVSSAQSYLDKIGSVGALEALL